MKKYSEMTLEEIDELSKDNDIICDGDSQSLIINGKTND